ncbi:XdhC family protein [Amycolatopsis sp., V23-08]|uniref:XdhC family protein n=1 Tax=Amycolatopsis heterodermiae TaxID=3110235 RepID=A0ABU5RAH4_9PSEU|nr:XdhC family protein [Amycolatopsis sp., V23-08]MEA5363238.1 XdhC family protein [Amycolatopsis sp., V23-08]
MGGWDVLAEAGDRARRGEAFALATVVWREGPSSGKESCRAIVTEDGELHGWIGGACAEPVVLREARQALAEGTPRLLLLGTPERFGTVPDGMTVVPIACQSEGALEIYVEPVVPAPHLVVAGRSPLAHTLVALAAALDWRAELSEDLAAVTGQSYVVIATQGHNDEEALERALARDPAYVGLVGSRRRGEAVLGYLADRGVAPDRLARVQVPAGVDLGAVAHREIAVAVLAELVRLRAVRRPVPVVVEEAVDPVCGMTVSPRDPVEYEGVAYHFCCSGCRGAFERDPAAYAKKESRC